MWRNIDWFRVLMILTLGVLVIWFSIVIGRTPLGLAFGQNVADAYVYVPAEYRWADKTLLKPGIDYSHTRVMWGTCGPIDPIDTLMGEVLIRAYNVSGPLYNIPVGQEFCAIAVVVSPQGAPLGASNTARFTIPSGTKPGHPVDLRLRF